MYNNNILRNMKERMGDGGQPLIPGNRERSRQSAAIRNRIHTYIANEEYKEILSNCINLGKVIMSNRKYSVVYNQ